MISAIEARAISDVRKDFDSVFVEIRKAADLGLYSCKVDNLDNPKNQVELVRLGYKLSHETDSGHYVSTTISWRS